MKRLLSVLSCMLLLILIIASCKKTTDSSSKLGTNLSLPEVDYQYIQNDKLAKLGRVLFYDKSLSANNSTSCGSCHKQQLAFADDQTLSPGFDNRVGNRNTPPIQNLRNFESQLLFWDGRETNINEMVTQPVFNHVEMGIRSNEYLLENILSKAYYTELFNDAYPDGKITLFRIGQSLAHFTTSLQSNQAEFDLPEHQRSFEVNEGEKLFFGKYNCGNCHNLRNPKGYDGSPIFFTDPNTGLMKQVPNANPMMNIGLDMNYADKGLGELTKNPDDNGKFKIPNLRNISLTAPYMHDGRFKTLDEVLNFYSQNISNHPNLNSKLVSENSVPQVLSISSVEKKYLIRFLESLTDHQFINDPKFSDPFVNR